MTVTKVSKVLKVGERGIYHAKLVLEKGTEEEIADCDSGKGCAEWLGRDMTQSQRAAVAVEQASFNEHGGDRTKESFKVENSTLNEIADSQGIGRNLIAWAKAVWDAAEEARDRCFGETL